MVFVVVVFVVTVVVVVVTPIAGNTSSKNMIDGEIAAVVVAVVIVAFVVFVVIVDISLAAEKPPQRQTWSNSATRQWKIALASATWPLRAGLNQTRHHLVLEMS